MVQYFYNALLYILIFNISFSSIFISEVGYNFPSFIFLTSPTPSVIPFQFGRKIVCWGSWLTQLLEHATLDLRVVSLSRHWVWRLLKDEIFKKKKKMVQLSYNK